MVGRKRHAVPPLSHLLSQHKWLIYMVFYSVYYKVGRWDTKINMHIPFRVRAHASREASNGNPLHTQLLSKPRPTVPPPDFCKQNQCTKVGHIPTKQVSHLS